MTFCVSEAVEAFLMPVSGLALDLSSSEEVLFLSSVVPLPLVASLSAPFLRFLLPAAFLSACVRFFSRRVLTRRLRRAMSVGRVGTRGIMSFSA